VVFILFGCGSSTKQAENVEIVDYRTGIASSPNLSITVPSGWREIDDNKNKIFEIWLVNKENNASIGFIPIHLDKRFGDKSDVDKHKLVVDLLLNKKKSTASDFKVLLNEENSSNYNFTTIKYLTDNKLQNSIIFGTGDLFYESLAYSDNNSDLSESEIEEIFKVQNDIVTTSQIK
ncbi:MAG: hypothetical protein R3250_04185, partial [Melioribacteraceae bacterium]|nr:hypothetical protein [Melioribacteraceae bacterium]